MADRTADRDIHLQPLVIPHRVLSAGTSAEEILQGAREEADRLLAEARTKASAIESAAFLDGLNRGLMEVDAAMEAAVAFRESIERNAESDLVSLCVSIVGRLIDSDAETYRQTLREMVSEALSLLRSDRGVTICLSPSDGDLLADHFASIDPIPAVLALVRIRKVDQLKKGECLLESSRGSIRCSIRSRLDAIENAIRDSIEIPEQEGVDT